MSPSLHFGHFTPVFLAIDLIFLHSGYLLHPRKAPNRPRFTTIGAPHFSQTSPLFSASSFFSSSVFSVYLHSGYFMQAMNFPKRPNFTTRSPPHLGHCRSSFSTIFS